MMRRPLIWASLAAAMTAATTANTAAQTVIYVDDDAPEGGDGFAWQTAFRDLQDALDAARCIDPVEIRVADGTYIPSGANDTPRDRFVVDALRGGCGLLLSPPNPDDFADAPNPLLHDQDSVQSHPNLSSIVFSIRGAFAGLARPDNPDLRDPDQFVTVLSGDRLGDDRPDFRNRSDNTKRVLEIHSRLGTDTLLLEHLTIRGAGVDRYYDDVSAGAGVYIASTSGAVSLNYCHIIDNVARDRGGGILVASGPLTQFYRSKISSNRARHGGGISFHAWTKIYESTVSNNEAYYYGGGASGFAYLSSVSSTFADNQVNYSGGGGAIHIANANYRIISTLFVGNQAEQGASMWSAGNGTILNCTILQNNSSSSDLFYGNERWANIAIVNSVLVRSSTEPMIVFEKNADTARLWFRTSMIDNDENAFQLNGAQLVWADSIVAPPRFVDPVGPDGLASTWEDNDYHPGPGSAAIDSADSNYSINCYSNSYDADGHQRDIDAINYADTNSVCSGGAMDMGAFEAAADTPRLCNADWNADEIVDVNDAIAFLYDFQALHPGADLNRDSLWDFYDLQLFLRDFAAGCP
jgi:hypothetical protein